MPYVSEAQRGKFHELLKQGKISQATVDEFDKASKGLKLPARSGAQAKRPGAIQSAMQSDAAKRRAFYGG